MLLSVLPAVIIFEIKYREMFFVSVSGSADSGDRRNYSDYGLPGTRPGRQRPTQLRRIVCGRNNWWEYRALPHGTAGALYAGDMPPYFRPMDLGPDQSFRQQ